MLPSDIQLNTLWGVGPHRVLCADVETGAAMRLYAAMQPLPTLLLTDPPWNPGMAKSFRTLAAVGGEANFEVLLERLRELLITHQAHACIEMGKQYKHNTHATLVACLYRDIEETVVPYGKSFSYYISGTRAEPRPPWPAPPRETNGYKLAVERWTDRGDGVFDMFCGLGRMLVAAAKAGRVGYGVELSPIRAHRSLEALQEVEQVPIVRLPW